MLIGTLGIRLVLLLGKVLPLPPPPGLAVALKEATVTNDADGPDGFQLTFSLGKDLLDYGLVSGGSLDPMTRVVLGVLMGISPEILIDGVVTHHQLAPGDEPGTATLTVTGRDLTQVMDLEERNDTYENQPDYVIVTRIIGQYARYGLLPRPTPTTDVPIELQRVPRQHETDLAFIRRLAQQNGFVFYVEPVSLGVNQAYWGPEIRAGVPQPALSVDMGPATNVRSLRFSNDALASVGASGTFVEPFLKLPIPIPQLPSLRLPPLARSPATPHRTVLLRDTANENPARAAVAGVATTSRAPEPVTADGDLDAVRYGHVLRARRPVGVRGVGATYDGNYFVRRVTHAIGRGRYTQSFSLSREGTGALLPVVRP
ncbi:MAG: phage late control D family protein [Actinomycetota bacterium]